jgi:PhnB protein
MEIPKGHQTLMPYFIVDGADRFRDFIRSVFNATITYEGTAPDGTMGHCEARIGDSTIMFGASGGPWEPRTSDLFIYVNDADEVYKRALKNGATTVLEPENKSYGRSCGVTDPFGNIWWITSIVPAK